MPTYSATRTFHDDYDRLSREEKDLFRSAVTKMVAAEQSGAGFPPALRIKPMRGKPGIWEMTWDGNNGRATFRYGEEERPGLRHFVWLRVGGHAIFGA
ncbi:MAG: hypothetical protein V9E94_19330 [Microthrixaceae bacterium]